MMQAGNEVPHISPEEALERAQRGAAVLIDVREPGELEVVAIEGAVNVPMSVFDAAAVIDAAGEKEIVFFCRSGRRAIDAWQYFTQNTGRDAVCMTGSIMAWFDNGLPVTTA